MIKFIADSSIDILDIAGVHFQTVPLTIYTEERTYIDDANLNLSGMLDYMAAFKGRSYTSCPSTEAWLKAYEGADEIYAVTLTSNLSGTYNSAMVARDIYLADHPQAKILIVDTLSVGPEMRLMMEKMVDWHKAGLSFEEIEMSTQTYLNSTRLFFAFQSLHNLAQNGRIPKIASAAINVLNITITGTASEDGHVKPTGKARGEKKVLNTLYNDMQEAGYQGGKVRICHAENSLLAVRLAALVQTRHPGADVQICTASGICGYYGERGGVIVACEC